MLQTPVKDSAKPAAAPPDPPVTAAAVAASAAPAPVADEAPGLPSAAEAQEPKGCLFALSQPPLMLFLCVIGTLLGAGAAWDLLAL